MEFVIVDRNGRVRRTYVSDITILTSVIFSFSRHIDGAVKLPDFASALSIMTQFINAHDDMKLMVDESQQIIQAFSTPTDTLEFEVIPLDRARIESVMSS